MELLVVAAVAGIALAAGYVAWRRRSVTDPEPAATAPLRAAPDTIPVTAPSPFQPGPSPFVPVASVDDLSARARAAIVEHHPDRKPPEARAEAGRLVGELNDALQSRNWAELSRLLDGMNDA